jgi:CHAT domain-containing protein/tetratricopeptide (TPR) repeat protein
LLWAQPEKPAPALSGEEQQLAKHVKELNAEGERLYDEGKFIEAIKVFRRALDFGHRLYPKDRFPNGHNELATSINNLAEAHEAAGDYANAEPLFQEALAMRRFLFPKDRFPIGHPDLAGSIDNLASLYHSAGKLAIAAPLYQEALAMRRVLFPKERYPNGHPDLATSINNLGYLHKSAGKYAKAEPLYLEALAMRRDLFPRERYPNGHPAVALSINNLAVLYKAAGEYAKAEPLYQEALALRRIQFSKASYPNGHPDLALSINNLAVLYRTAGEYAKAESLYQEALAMRRLLFPKKDYPNGHPELASSIDNLAALYRMVGEHAKAELLSLEALAMRRLLFPKDRYPNGHPDLAFSVNNLASLYESAGEYARAEPLYLEALSMRRVLFPKELHPNGHPELAGSINNLAGLYKSTGEYGKAEPLFQEALAMYRFFFPKERYPNGHSSLATSINNLGSLHYAARQYAKAEPLYQEALAMCRHLFPKERYPNGHPDLAQSINNLATLYLCTGDYAKAEPLSQEALSMRRVLFPKERYPSGHPHLAHSILNQAGLHAMAGDYARAEPLYQEALRMDRLWADAFLSSAAEAEAMNFLASQPITRDAFLSTTRRLPTHPGHYAAVWSGRAPLLRLLERRRLDLAAARDPAAAGLAIRLAGARLRLSRALLARTGTATADLARLTADKEDLEKQLATLRGLSPRPRLDELSLETLAAALGNRAAFIDLVSYTDIEQDPLMPGIAGEHRTPRYVAFVVAAGRAAARVELGEAGPIERAWTNWREAIVAGRADRIEAATLARLIWEPLREHLPSGCKSVWLCPDGALCQVPWAALPGKDKDTVLLEQYALAVVPHGPYLAAALRGEVPAGSAQKGVLVVGGVDYDGAPVELHDDAVASLHGPAIARERFGISSLPGTLAESRRIRAEASVTLKVEAVVLNGCGAGVASVLAELPKARYAHLATHGFFADASVRSVLQVDEKHFLRAGTERAGAGARNPLVLSGLVLAGANRADAADRGILTAEGIVGLNLEGMELAVLSACETGLGEVAGGEGVLGLVRAFHVAGTRNVVASLWRVEDASTSALMGRFYEKLWAEKKSPLEALREAQLEVYRNPGRIAEWSKREFSATEVALPKLPAATPKAGARARTAQWAAFVLSGVGR